MNLKQGVIRNMLILDIIDWCNSNQEFIGALLSLLTFIVSIIAIITSVITARKLK